MQLTGLILLAALASATPRKEKRRCRPISATANPSNITSASISLSQASNLESYPASTASYPGTTISYSGNTELYPIRTISSCETSSASIQVSISVPADTNTLSSTFDSVITTSAVYSSSDTASSTSTIGTSSMSNTPIVTPPDTDSSESASTRTASYSSISTDSTAITPSTITSVPTSTSSDAQNDTASSSISSSAESATSLAPTPTPTFYLKASGILKGTGNQKNYLPRSNDKYAELYSSGNSANSEILTFAVSSPASPATTFYIDDQSRLVNAADGYILNTYESATSNQVYWDENPTGGGWAAPTCQVNSDSTLACSIGIMNQFSICFGSSGTGLGSNGLLYLTANPPDQGSSCRGVTVNVVYA